MIVKLAPGVSKLSPVRLGENENASCGALSFFLGSLGLPIFEPSLRLTGCLFQFKRRQRVPNLQVFEH